MFYLVFCIYSLLFLLLGKHSLLCKYKYERIVSLTILLISAFSYIVYVTGFRPLVGVTGDTIHYISVYDKLADVYSSRSIGIKYYGNKEYLFWPVSALIKIVGFSPRAWFVFISFISSFLILLAYQKLAPKKYSVFLFSSLFLTYYIVFSLAIRQSIAEGCVLLSYSMALYNRNKSSLFFALIGFGFHQSALGAFLFIPLIRFFKKQVSFYLIIFIFLICALSSILVKETIPSILYSFDLMSLYDKVKAYTSPGMNFEFVDLYAHKMFWLVIIVSISYLYFQRKSADGLYIYIYIFMSLILLFICIPVISGRLIAYLNDVLPLMVIQILHRILPLHKKLAIYTYSILFIMMSSWIVCTENAIRPLGLLLR